MHKVVVILFCLAVAASAHFQPEKGNDAETNQYQPYGNEDKNDQAVQNQQHKIEYGVNVPQAEGHASQAEKKEIESIVHTIKNDGSDGLKRIVNFLFKDQSPETRKVLELVPEHFVLKKHKNGEKFHLVKEALKLKHEKHPNASGQNASPSVNTKQQQSNVAQHQQVHVVPQVLSYTSHSENVPHPLQAQTSSWQPIHTAPSHVTAPVPAPQVPMPAPQPKQHEFIHYNLEEVPPTPAAVQKQIVHINPVQPQGHHKSQIQPQPQPQRHEFIHYNYEIPQHQAPVPAPAVVSKQISQEPAPHPHQQTHNNINFEELPLSQAQDHVPAPTPKLQPQHQFYPYKFEQPPQLQVSKPNRQPAAPQPPPQHHEFVQYKTEQPAPVPQPQHQPKHHEFVHYNFEEVPAPQAQDPIVHAPAQQSQSQNHEFIHYDFDTPQPQAPTVAKNSFHHAQFKQSQPQKHSFFNFEEPSRPKAPKQSQKQKDQFSKQSRYQSTTTTQAPTTATEPQQQIHIYYIYKHQSQTSAPVLTTTESSIEPLSQKKYVYVKQQSQQSAPLTTQAPQEQNSFSYHKYNDQAAAHAPESIPTTQPQPHKYVYYSLQQQHVPQETEVAAAPAQQSAAPEAQSQQQHNQFKDDFYEY